MVWTSPTVIDLRMEKVDLAANGSDSAHVRLLPKRTNPPPALDNKPGKNCAHDLVTVVQVLGLRTRDPQACLTQFFQPHLKVMQAVACGQGGCGKCFVSLEIGGRLEPKRLSERRQRRKACQSLYG